MGACSVHLGLQVACGGVKHVGGPGAGRSAARTRMGVINGAPDTVEGVVKVSLMKSRRMLTAEVGG